MASGTLDTPAGTAPTTLAGPNGNGRAAIPARTLRTDNWRKAPILTVVLLTAWIGIALIVRALELSRPGPSKETTPEASRGWDASE